MRSYSKTLIPVPDQPGTLWAGPRPMNTADVADVDLVVCLIPPGELPPVYARNARDAGHLFVPVPDFGVPPDPASWDAAVERVISLLSQGKQVLVHCQAGCGRTGTFCSGILVRCGTDPLEAIARFHKFRGCGPETEAQRQWVVAYAQRLA